MRNINKSNNKLSYTLDRVHIDTVVVVVMVQEKKKRDDDLNL